MKALSVALPLLALIGLLIWLVLRPAPAPLAAVDISQDCILDAIDRKLPAEASAMEAVTDDRIIATFAAATDCMTRHAITDCYTFGMTPTDGSCTDQALARLTQAETEAMAVWDDLPERLQGIVGSVFARAREADPTCGGSFDELAAGRATSEVICAGILTGWRVAVLQVAAQMARARAWSS